MYFFGFTQAMKNIGFIIRSNQPRFPARPLPRHEMGWRQLAQFPDKSCDRFSIMARPTCCRAAMSGSKALRMGAYGPLDMSLADSSI